MPLVFPSTYRPPFGFRNGHVQTVWPALFRRVPVVTTQRERIDTPDGDFLDLDWSPQRSRWLVVLSHGLEGDSRQSYVQGMARAFVGRGWDALAWNLRGCSGTPNRLPYSYHSGSTGDLQAVLDHVFASGGYDEVALVGFSLGGNITLKYLGDRAGDVDSRIVAGVAFSVPTDLASCAQKMAGRAQGIYMRRFMNGLRTKVREKIRSHPDRVTDIGLDRMRTFREFDGGYTAPLNGFSSAEDYWTQCSSKPVLPDIQVPTLLVNAVDDPFLGEGCHPGAEAGANRRFYFENPYHGGHVGFMANRTCREFWSETRAVDFVASARGQLHSARSKR